jgi:hypothetical protein
MDSKCRMCYKVEEHIKHTVAWCTTLVPSERTNRNNKVAGYIHWTICQRTGLQVTDRYCDHMDIMWTCTWKGHKCQQYHYYVGRTSYRTLNSTGKLIWYNTEWKKEKTCLLIGIAIPDDSNVNTKETEKLRMYKDLEIKVSRMWEVGTKIIPAVIGALGAINKGLVQNLQLLPCHRSATELQKVTLMSSQLTGRPQSYRRSH